MKRGRKPVIGCNAWINQRVPSALLTEFHITAAAIGMTRPDATRQALRRFIEEYKYKIPA